MIPFLIAFMYPFDFGSVCFGFSIIRSILLRITSNEIISGGKQG